MTQEGGDELEFDREKQAIARERERWVIRLGVLRLATLALLIFIFLETGLSLRLEEFAARLTPNLWMITALYVTAGYGLLLLFTLPFQLLRFRQDRGYGLSKQGWVSWGFDRLKSFALGLMFALIAIEALYWCLRNFGERWWLVAWILALVSSVAMGYLAPVVLLPVFYRVRPLDEEELTRRLRNLAEKARIRVVGVYEFEASAKTEAGMAALAGIGRTRRILLSDHIRKGFSEREVTSILAHELAHHARGDSARGLLQYSVLAFAGLLLADLFVRWSMPSFGLQRIDGVANLPLFLLFFLGFSTATSPLMNTLSRRREAGADRLAVSLCEDPRALASALAKLHDTNLSNASPSPWIEALFYTHPSGTRRVKMLLSFPSNR